MKRIMGHAIGKGPPLPFKVGQMVEIRSFIKGYRGAWFRCEIKDISRKGSYDSHFLRYIDYPDDDDEWTKSYETPPIGWSKKREKQLMLRPQYPPVYSSDQVHSINTISDVIIVSDGIWRVGDLVDWFKEGCFWSAQVTQLLGDEKAKVDLLLPPWGEGQSYSAPFSDLRPSLDWSLEDGWTVPTSMEGGILHCCAKIVYPVNQTAGNQLVSKVPAESEGCHLISSELQSNLATDSHAQLGSPENEEVQLEYQIRPKEVTETSSRTTRDGSESPKNVKPCIEVPLNSTHKDTFEAAIMDVEEMANKLIWLENILKFDMSSSNVGTSLWEFVEHRGSSLPK